MQEDSSDDIGPSDDGVLTRESDVEDVRVSVSSDGLRSSMSQERDMVTSSESPAGRLQVKDRVTSFESRLPVSSKKS